MLANNVTLIVQPADDMGTISKRNFVYEIVIGYAIIRIPGRLYCRYERQWCHFYHPHLKRNTAPKSA